MQLSGGTRGDTGLAWQKEEHEDSCPGSAEREGSTHVIPSSSSVDIVAWPWMLQPAWMMLSVEHLLGEDKSFQLQGPDEVAGSPAIFRLAMEKQ